MQKIRGLNFLPKKANYDEIDSPVGILTLIATAKGLHAVLWDVDIKHADYKKLISNYIKMENDAVILETKKQLDEYFAGQRKKFNLPLVLNGTAFQMQAWQQLQKIPYAETITYGEQAKRVGDKKKARAVGMANGLNPISIIVPCHRVIGSNGQLVGFGGGLERKAYLLNLEQKYL